MSEDLKGLDDPAVAGGEELERIRNDMLMSARIVDDYLDDTSKIECDICHVQIFGNNYITVEQTVSNLFRTKHNKLTLCRGCYMKEFII